MNWVVPLLNTARMAGLEPPLLLLITEKDFERNPSVWTAMAEHLPVFAVSVRAQVVGRTGRRRLLRRVENYLNCPSAFASKPNHNIG
jgi:hypothetical protein